MQSYVIIIKGNEKSEASAQKTIESAKKHGIDVDTFWAVTPKDNVTDMALRAGIQNLVRFDETYSRTQNCLAAFLSHYTLWMKCVSDKEPLIIFEHDAVVVDYIPADFNFTGCMNIGRPSYGKFNIPNLLGTNPLSSKRYFPGAHAYMIKPVGAADLIEKSKLYAGPTDVFLHLDLFPWLQEYYPWPVECHDSFTTIQNENGCLAKHNNGPNYEII